MRMKMNMMAVARERISQTTIATFIVSMKTRYTRMRTLLIITLTSIPSPKATAI